ncbi:MAG: cytochrome c peroxidase [Planctomycetota bacterium]
MGLLLVTVLAIPKLPSTFAGQAETPITADQLRDVYSQSPEHWPAMVVDKFVDAAELGLLPPMPYPADNPPSKAKEQLGRQLFYDPRLSASNQMACVSCHDPDLGWADGRTVSFGTRRLELPRNAPTIKNSGYFDQLFWDGRAESLEDLSLKVIENADEMHGMAEQVAAKLDAVPEYHTLFAEVFEREGPIQVVEITQAIATFVRAQNGGRSAFDRFLKGRKDALSDSELRGLHLFRTKALCMNCHHGPTLSDGRLHSTGLSLYGTRNEDLGQFHVTGKPEDSGKFKTPSLRDISRTRPYMHHGLFESLEVTVRAYNGGMPTPRARKDRPDDLLLPTKSPLLRELNLTEQEQADLVAFMESLEEPHRRIVPPKLPPFADQR